MNIKKVVITAAFGVGLLTSALPAFARDRDDFRQDQNRDRREYRERRDDRRDFREDRRDNRYYREPVYNYAPQYYREPVYNYPPRPTYRPGFSGSFYFGAGR